MKLIYFAWIRERIGRGEEEITPPDDVLSVADLLALFKRDRGEELSDDALLLG